MARTILVPVDLVDDHPGEVAFAREIAQALHAEIVLLHVVDYVPTMFPVELPGGFPAPQVDLVKAAAEKKLAAVAEAFQGQKVRVAVEVGAAAATIVEVARREKADHIVIGSHSRRTIARVLLGSVADRVAHTAPCPVTIVRETEHGGAGAPPVE